MKRERRYPTKAEWAALTSSRPVVRVLSRRPEPLRERETSTPFWTGAHEPHKV
jgi:hypothetical protein